MTLKTVLKNFLNYADTLEAQKKLGKDLYEIDFQKLKALTEELKHDEDYSTSEGLKEVNRRKNRYKDILPYNYTRVILSEYPGVPGSDFINANYIKGASGSLAYIASQGPLPNTVVDFWRMIWECEIQVIVMACNERESGKYKCECYWPTDEEKKQYGNISVEFVKWRQVCPDFLVRTLRARWEGEERVLCQFHYTTWPDHGVPRSVQPILELVRLMRDCQASEAVPILVHCSAGCGRTGTICAIDFVWGLMRMGKLTKHFNLFNVIADMRRQRIAMVQTKEQYVLVHKAVSSLFEQQLRVIDSHTYENLDEDGEPLILRELNHKEEDIYEDILEPIEIEETFISEDKVGKKLHSLKAFNEFPSGNRETPQVNLLQDFHPETSSFHTEKPALLRDCDRSVTAIEPTTRHDEGNLANEQDLENNIKDDNDPPYSRNSKILLKLCREESVKRLISGWNKAAEKVEDIKSKESYSEGEAFSKPADKKHSDSLRPDGESNNFVGTLGSGEHSTTVYQQTQFISEMPSKNSSPDDLHGGKLVGKATVIRRPSIAKLKALFEKNPQSSTDTPDSGKQRRPLFRSHSHYIGHSGRTFTISDDTEQGTDMSHESRSGSQSKEGNYANLSSSKPVKNMESNYTSMKLKLKQSNSADTKREKPPELPVKKKPAPTVPTTVSNVSDKVSPETVVPRFHVNISKENQSVLHSTNKDFVQHEISSGKSGNDAEKSKIVRNSINIVSSQERKSSDLFKESRRHSQDVEKLTLHKMQSFSDPEQSTGRCGDVTKQLIKPKLSLTDQTHPKLPFAQTEKANSEDKLSYLHETTYMNINSLAQKNIRQIEDKLKCHPRGAIIDLTSRKSYIDETVSNPDKQHVFRNTVEPVKFVQRLESRDLTSMKKEQAESTSKELIKSPKDKQATSKSESSKHESDDLDAKNLLLHSPPPKSKRGHVAKPHPKLSSTPTADVSSSDVVSTSSKQTSGESDQNKHTMPKSPLNLVNSNLNQGFGNSAIKSPAADRSDPRYFPVNRQTAVDAKYESEKHKAINRNPPTVNVANIYESHFFPKSQGSIYHKLPVAYDKYTENFDKATSQAAAKDKKYFVQNEPLYGLQRSTSGPQIIPSSSDIPKAGSELNRTFPAYGQVGKDTRKNEPSSLLESRLVPQNSSPGLYGVVGHQNAFPPGPPKPPRTYHYDIKNNNQDHSIPSEQYKNDQIANRDGGRYIVSIASPKHSVPHPGNSGELSDSRHTDRSEHHAVVRENRHVESRVQEQNPSTVHHQSAYTSPLPNEVHMSRSYPFTNYDRLYSHPRPYGKQFYPEAIGFRNVQPVQNGIYGTVKEKPRYGPYTGQRTTYADYENIYDAQRDYMHAMNKEHQNMYQSIYSNPAAIHKYSKSDGGTYGTTRAVSGPFARDSEYRSADDGVPKRVYFDTLQRRHKQHVSWEQRRSHDDMDIRPAPSARLKEQIHARRSMVELDNLEISVASKDGFPEENVSGATSGRAEKGTSLEGGPFSKVPKMNPGDSAESGKDLHKKAAPPGREPASFGETLSKAFGRLTSLTKFNTKDAQTSSSSSSESFVHIPKGSTKQKERRSTPPDSSKESPSEQWTQV
ncbi:uncharacterized protein LOC129230317 [Uloborus diversus]|uniref:uncharacterized protein LOC129230317 n=1 Tax=Uloborus diversus TaxID=327109 RepID=UPI00240A61E7|nr:uncharacterized protein LOC129230317 [Uloborus diversus]